MTLVINTPSKTPVIKPEKAKPKPPVQWNVVLYNESKNPHPCAECVLSEVFNKNHPEAVRLAQEAYDKGKEVVFTSSQEVAEQKAIDTERFQASQDHHCIKKGFSGIRFVAQPV